mgnify:CR=1 FL=1
MKVKVLCLTILWVLICFNANATIENVSKKNITDHSSFIEKDCIPKENKNKSKSVICIKKLDLKKLGTYKEFKAYPEGMLKIVNKGCKSWSCTRKKAGKKVYELFVRRPEVYHARKPGAMIHGMAWFEVMYLGKLYDNRKVIERFKEHGPDSYKNYKPSGVNLIPAKMQKDNDKKKLKSLIKMNEGRIKMREALGLSLKDDLETVLRRHWLLGDFLNNDEVKVKKAKIDPDIRKRDLLLSKYKTAIKKYKKKLIEEKSINTNTSIEISVESTEINNNKNEKLNQLTNLYKQGALTEDQYEKAKKKLIEERNIN